MITASPGTVVYNLAMKDGSIGWTFSLPVGINNNDKFVIVGTEVQVGATALPAGKHTFAVDATKAGQPTPGRKVISFSVGDLGVSGLTSSGSNMSISTSIVPVGSHANGQLKAFMHIPVVDANFTIELLCPDSAGTGVSTVRLVFNTNGNVDCTWRTNGGTGQSYTWTGACLPGGFFAPGWHSFRVTSPDTTMRFYIDETERLSSSSTTFNVGASAGQVYFLATNTEVVLSNIEISLAGSVVISEQLSVSGGDISISGSATAGKKGHIGTAGFVADQSSRAVFPNGVLPVGTPTSMEISFDLFAPSDWGSSPMNFMQVLGTFTGGMTQNAIYAGLISISQANGGLRIYQYSNWDVTRGSGLVKESAPVGQWISVKYTWDGTASRLYVNGVQAETNGVAPYIPSGDLRIAASRSDIIIQDLYLKINNTVYIAEQMNGISSSKLTSVGALTTKSK